MKIKNKKLYAPEIIRYIEILSYKNGVRNKEMDKWMDLFFQEMNRLEPCTENGKRELWLCIERGPIEVFGDYEEAYEAEEVSDYEEFKNWWLEEFPNEKNWYLLETIENQGDRVIALNHRVIFHYGPNEDNGFHDSTELIQYLTEVVKECIVEIERGTYNQKLQDELPYFCRTGTISREKYWSIFQEEKEEYFKNISKEDVTEFISIIKMEKNKTMSERILNLTANDFFRSCSIGYYANQYQRLEGKTWKEQYNKYADGRCEGLTEIDGDSPEEFLNWYQNRKRCGGHPWEVCRGGNSTHISLYVRKDEFGFFYELVGSSYGRSIETIKFFLALRRNNIPVILHDSEMLMLRLLGKEKIGIVPRGVFPCYCFSRFPGENINDFINLPRENEGDVIKAAVWQTIPVINLMK
ncbi:hypothetical protein [Anaerotignum sp.]